MIPQISIEVEEWVTTKYAVVRVNFFDLSKDYPFSYCGSTPKGLTKNLNISTEKAISLYLKLLREYLKNNEVSDIVKSKLERRINEFDPTPKTIPTKCLRCGEIFQRKLQYKFQKVCSKCKAKKEKIVYSKICANESCKAPFQTFNKRKLYHSKTCKNTAQTRRWRQKRSCSERTRICIICGSQFQSTNSQKLTCGSECAKKRRAQRDSLRHKGSRSCVDSEHDSEGVPYGNEKVGEPKHLTSTPSFYQP